MTEGVNDDSRWDTPCGVHHGWVFAMGFCAGLLTVVLVAALVIPHV